MCEFDQFLISKHVEIDLSSMTNWSNWQIHNLFIFD